MKNAKQNILKLGKFFGEIKIQIQKDNFYDNDNGVKFLWGLYSAILNAWGGWSENGSHRLTFEHLVFRTKIRMYGAVGGPLSPG